MKYLEVKILTYLVRSEKQNQLGVLRSAVSVVIQFFYQEIGALFMLSNFYCSLRV